MNAASIGVTFSGAAATLAWLAPGGCAATGYDVSVSLERDPLAPFLIPATATSVTVTWADSEPRYVRIRSRNANGSGEWSGLAVLRRDVCGTIPGPPTLFAVAMHGDAGVQMTWSAPTGACAPTRYEFEADNGLERLSGFVVATSHFTTLPSGTWRLRARSWNLNGSSLVWSNEVFVTIRAGVAPCSGTPAAATMVHWMRCGAT